MSFQFKKPARSVNRVFIHCSASDNPAHDNVATMRAWHLQRGWSDVGYHLFIRKDGTVEEGRALSKTPAAQAGHNRGTIAICLHGLKKSKFTAAQKRALVGLCQQINNAYVGNITFHGHCEVSPKACPVIDYKRLLKLSGSGKLLPGAKLGALKSVTIADMELLEEPDDLAKLVDAPILKHGSTGFEVKHLQRALVDLGYHVGKIDGHFGGRTRGAVLAFQADNHLIADAIVGPATREALRGAEKRYIAPERGQKTVSGLASDGSRIAQASLAQGLMGSGFAAGGALTLFEQASGTVSRLTESFGTFGTALQLLGPWLGAIVVIGGLIVVLQSVRAGRARRDDHRSGKTA